MLYKMVKILLKIFNVIIQNMWQQYFSPKILIMC